jgi:hypothetical protein
MRVAASSALCDAIETGVLQLGRSLTPQDVVKEVQGVADNNTADLVHDAFSVAIQRATFCPKGYPFVASDRLIERKPSKGFSAYLFLLLGCSLKHGGAVDTTGLGSRFSKYFEDLVCWSLRRAGFLAQVLSEPREERGLPKSLKPALRAVAKRFDEQSELIEAKVTVDDNDLGVDVIATTPQWDRKRSGRPVFLFQCATGPVDKLSSKMAEDMDLFPGVWSWGFYRKSGIRGGATPYDLLGLERVFWDRLSAEGWVLDRMRLVALANAAITSKKVTPKGLLDLSNELRDAIPNFDWRNGWQYSL